MKDSHHIFNSPTDLHHLSEMIFVEGGTFRMGASDDDTEAYNWEKPAHDVQLSSFYIGKYPVTQALWEYVMGSNPSVHKGANRPVENVSWHEAQDFIEKLNQKTGQKYHLPTEAQWEYAALGGEYWQEYPFKYIGSDKLHEVAWYDENSHNETKPVGLKTSNLLGIHDMSGNVWEWCEDKDEGLENYDRVISELQKNSVTGALINPTGVVDGTYRIQRGGSYFSNTQHSRLMYRRSRSLSYRSYNIGFRLALDLSSV